MINNPHWAYQYISEKENKIMDIIEKIKNDEYVPDMVLPDRPEKPHLQAKHNSRDVEDYAIALIDYEGRFIIYQKDMLLYRELESKCYQDFKVDALEDSGIGVDHPKAEKAFTMAWERGHASGYYEVYQELCDLADLLV